MAFLVLGTKRGHLCAQMVVMQGQVMSLSTIPAMGDQAFYKVTSEVLQMQALVIWHIIVCVFV